MAGWTSGFLRHETAGDGTAALVETPAIACQDSHRVETFSLAEPALGRDKRLLIYLPPGYGCTDRRYPVFYFNDGHDLFAWNPFAADLDPKIAAAIAAREAWYGSWRLDEQLDRATGDLPAMIVVGIASDDGLRRRDLAPVPWDGSAETRGLEYGKFVADTVVPVVDRIYRTVAKARCRGVGGASLGGVSALQIGLSYPQSFGVAFALSRCCVIRRSPGFLPICGATQAMPARACLSMSTTTRSAMPTGDGSNWWSHRRRSSPSSGRRAAVTPSRPGRSASSRRCKDCWRDGAGPERPPVVSQITTSTI